MIRAFAAWFAEGLGREGYRVVGCKRGALAPRMAMKLQPSVIILDAHLGGGISGFQVCAVLKQVKATRDIPVLMISGVYLADEYREKARLLGAAGYIGKTELWPGLKIKIGALLQAKTHLATVAHAAEDRPAASTILVADDEDEWLSLTSRWLTDAGYRVITTGRDSSVAGLAALLTASTEVGLSTD